MATKLLILTPPEQKELQRRVRSRTARAEDSRRARVIMELAAGRGLRATANHLACSTSYVQRWARRFAAERMAGLVARHHGRKAKIPLESVKHAIFALLHIIIKYKTRRRFYFRFAQ